MCVSSTTVLCLRADTISVNINLPLTEAGHKDKLIEKQSKRGKRERFGKRVISKVIKLYRPSLRGALWSQLIGDPPKHFNLETCFLPQIEMGISQLLRGDGVGRGRVYFGHAWRTLWGNLCLRAVAFKSVSVCVCVCVVRGGEHGCVWACVCVCVMRGGTWLCVSMLAYTRRFIKFTGGILG